MLSKDRGRRGKERKFIRYRGPFPTIVNYPRGIMVRNDDGWKWANRYSRNGFDDRQQYNTYNPVSTTFVSNHFNSRWERKPFSLFLFDTITVSVGKNSLERKVKYNIIFIPVLPLYFLPFFLTHSSLNANNWTKFNAAVNHVSSLILIK